MPKRQAWDATHTVGHAALDAEHRSLLAHCNALADCLEAADGQRFDALFGELMVQAREHFAREEELLLQCGYPGMEDYRSECEEFDYLAREIVTPENFDRDELQTFLVLWWSGHILGAARAQRPYLERLSQS